MKKQNGIFLIICMAVFYLYSLFGVEAKTSINLNLDNIEVLSSGESYIHSCLGTGSLDCPISSIKVSFVTYL